MRSSALSLALLLLVASDEQAGGCRPGPARGTNPPVAPARGAAVGDVPGTRVQSPTLSGRASARALLEEAHAARSAVRSAPEAGRNGARRAAAQAYRAVRARFPADQAACAEASFWAGEMLRLAGDAAGAQAEYAEARRLGRRSGWGVRAAFEQGHLERRARRLDEALACYEAVLAHAAADRNERDQALVWIGRCQQQRGRARDALRAWRRVAEDGADALVRVEAFDLWALAYVAAGDLEAAAGVLALCQESLGALALEESRRGERLRAALESMRAIGELQSAIERRWRAR